MLNTFSDETSTTTSPFAAGDDHAVVPSAPAVPSSPASMPGATGAAAAFDYASHYVDEPAVQLRGDAGDRSPASVHAAAEHGVTSPSVALPHAEAIEASFGPTVAPQLAAIQAHVGGEAAEACGEMGAEAFASGNHVAFGSAPDLHTAAHEAAHVVQQAQGVSLYGGVGAAGNHHEAHADAVADRVVAGLPAADLFTAGAPSGGGGAVQLKERPRTQGPGPSVKMQESHQHAESESGEVLDTELKIIARKLAEGIPALSKAADNVAFTNSVVASTREDYEKTLKMVKRYQRQESEATDEYEVAEARRKVREWTRKRDEVRRELLLENEPKYSEIAKVRDTVLNRSLTIATRELKGILLQAKSMNLDDDDINMWAGADYVSHVMTKMRELTAALEMAGNQTDPLTGKPAWGGKEQQGLSSLTEAETVLADLRKTFKMTSVHKPAESDLEKDMDALETELVGNHLDAAVAHARYAQQAIDAWHALGNRHYPADGQYTNLTTSVKAMDDHLYDAQEAIARLDDAEKKKLGARLATVKKEVARVGAKGTRDVPASISGTIEYLPERLKALQGALRTAPARHR